jgi:hypothetical protein
MANEISINLTAAVNDSGNSVSGTATYSANFSGNFIGNEQTVGTTAEVVQFGDVTTPVIVLVKNLDTTNFIQVDSISTMANFPQKLHPGQGCLLLPETGTIYCKADTATCKVLVVAG